MFARLRYLLGWVLSFFRSRKDLVFENIALQQQLLALHSKRYGSPKLKTPCSRSAESL